MLAFIYLFCQNQKNLLEQFDQTGKYVAAGLMLNSSIVAHSNSHLLHEASVESLCLQLHRFWTVLFRGKQAIQSSFGYQ